MACIADIKLSCREMIARAHALHARSIAVTFDPHPVRVLRPQIPLRLITQQDQKLAWLAHSGIDAVLVLPFTRELSRLTAREFARTILHDSLQAIEVHEGDNFRFGADADADVNELSSLGEEFGFKVYVHSPTHRRGKAVSSSEVRNAIAAGNMRAARQLLGRPFRDPCDARTRSRLRFTLHRSYNQPGALQGIATGQRCLHYLS